MNSIRRGVVQGFEFLFHLVAGRPWTVFLTGFLPAVLCFFYAVTHLTFLPNFSGLSKDDAAYSKSYDAFVKEFNVQPEIMVVAKSPLPQKNEIYLKSLARSLSREPSIQSVYYQINLKPLRTWLLAYPSEATLKKIADVIQNAKPFFKALDYRIDLTNFWLTLPKFSQSSSADTMDVTGLLELKQLVNLMTRQAQGETLSSGSFEKILNGFSSLQETQYITLNGGKYTLLFARPVSEDRMEEAVRAIRQDMTRLAPQFPGVEGHLTGEPVLGVDEMESAKHDIAWAGLASLILASGIFIFGFRDWLKPLLSVIALLVGIGWSLAYIAVSVKHLNVFTLSLFPMLIGLAIDFSIQFLGRYREEIEYGHTPLEAIRKTYFHTGTGLLTAALTTAAGFFAISFAPYRGVAELGIATGGSLILCFLSTMTILPALLLITANRDQIAVLPAAISTVKAGNPDRYVLRHSTLILCLTLVLTLFLGAKARRIRFDHDILHLQSEKLDSIKTELELVRMAGKSSLYAVLVADNAPQAYRYINQLRSLDTVGSILSPFMIMPSDQKEKFPVLRTIHRQLGGFQILPARRPVEPGLLASAFEEMNGMIRKAQKQIDAASSGLDIVQALVLPGNGLLPHRSMATDLAHVHAALADLQTGMNEFLKTLKTMNPGTASANLTNFQTLLYDKLNKTLDLIRNGIPSRPMTFNDIPPEMRRQFIGKTGKIMIQVFPSQNIWERPALERFVGELRSVDPSVTGSPVLIYENTRLILESYTQAAKIAFVVIFLMAFLQFRKLSLTIFTLIPLGIGLIWLMGLMVLFGKSYNPANLLTLPVIIGIGVAFGVYVVNRYREEGHASIFSTSTGKAVLLSALTGTAGFASLLGVSHRGLQSLGFTMTIGLLSIMVQALFVLPALLNVFGQQRAKKGLP